VDQINRQVIGAHIDKGNRPGETVYGFGSRALIIHYFNPGELFENPMVPGRMEVLRKRHAVHAGFIEIRESGEDREGWNIVLVRPPGEIYGEWRLVETRVSALTGRMTRYEPIATNAQLFADNLACHWTPAMHTFQLTDRVLERADIVKIFDIFVPK
jgi:hypothetical protein